MKETEMMQFEQIEPTKLSLDLTNPRGTRHGLTPRQTADLRRCSAIKAETGPMKTDGRLACCPVKGAIATTGARQVNVTSLLHDKAAR